MPNQPLLNPHLLTGSPELERAIVERRPVSLRVSFAPFVPAVLSGGLILAVVGLAESWLVAIGAVAMIVGFGSLFMVRRIDVDTNSIALIPLLPFLPTQRLNFDALGPFQVRRSRQGSVFAPVDASAAYKVGGLLRRAELGIDACFRPSFSDEPLTADQLQQLLEGFRGAPARRVHVDPGLVVPVGRLRRNENIVLGVGTVAVIVVIAIIVAAVH